MNEVEQAPQGAGGLPSRPPSKPSRVPLLIWTGIAVFCLLMFGSALFLFLWSRENLGSKDLKRATSIKITYVVSGNQVKVVSVSNQAELQSLLDALEITDTHMGMQYGLNNQASVEFHLPNGTNPRVSFISPTQLDRANWGQVNVTPAFHRKVNEILSNVEGRRIDITRVDN